MAKSKAVVHEAWMRTGWLRLPKATANCVQVTIGNKDGHLGHLGIGRGGISWKSNDKQKVKRLSWTKLADLLDNHFGIK